MKRVKRYNPKYRVISVLLFFLLLWFFQSQRSASDSSATVGADEPLVLSYDSTLLQQRLSKRQKPPLVIEESDLDDVVSRYKEQFSEPVTMRYVGHRSPGSWPKRCPAQLSDLCQELSGGESADAYVFPAFHWRCDLLSSHMYEKLWVGFSLESDANYPILKTTMSGPGRIYDVTMWYNMDSDIIAGSLRGHLERLMRPPHVKTKFLNYIQSNCGAMSRRDKFVKVLMKYLPVDSYGRCLRNMQGLSSRHGSDWQQQRADLVGTYKFTLALHNSIAEDYVDERFFDTLDAGSVPVVLGPGNVDMFAPHPHSIIKTLDFGIYDPAKQSEEELEAGAQALARYLIYLNQSDSAYNQFLEYKKQGVSQQFQDLLATRGPYDARCRLCFHLMKLKLKGELLSPLKKRKEHFCNSV